MTFQWCFFTRISNSILEPVHHLKQSEGITRCCGELTLPLQGVHLDLGLIGINCSTCTQIRLNRGSRITSTKLMCDFVMDVLKLMEEVILCEIPYSVKAYLPSK